MFDSPGAPAYPPARNTWEFPPPELRKRWKWLAVLVGLLGLAVSSALIAVVVAVGGDDSPGLIEDAALLDSIADQCSIMTSTVESMPTSGSPQRRAVTIADQSRAVELMVAAIRADHPETVLNDQPAEQWLQDWEQLVQSRDEYALALLRDPNASFEVPLDPDGDPITDRMADVWLGYPVCEVPTELTATSTEPRSAI